MKCPQCDAWVVVKETRHDPKTGSIYRRKECGNLHKFTTVEQLHEGVIPASARNAGRRKLEPLPKSPRHIVRKTAPRSSAARD
ncbi:hypothetical protein EBT31_19195 [bacterium]|nr:hypothetical protein [bacterium]